MKRPYFWLHCYVLPASMVKEPPLGSNDDVEIITHVAAEACCID